LKLYNLYNLPIAKYIDLVSRIEFFNRQHDILMLQPQKFDFNPFATHNDACNRHSVHQLDSRHPGILVAHMLWIYCYTSSKSVVMRSDRRTTLDLVLEWMR